MTENFRIIKIGGVCGILGTLLYIGVALSDQLLWPVTKTTQEFLAVAGSPGYGRLNMAMHFTFVAALLMWVVAFLGLHRLLTSDRRNLAVSMGTVFGIVACAIMVQMSIVQGSVMVKTGQMFLVATNDTERQTAVALYKGLRYIDYGMDLAFDTFFFAAWISLACAMLRHAGFGKIIGIIGILLFVVDTPIQLWSAPDPPPFDIGPIGALWLLAVYIQMLRSARTASPLSTPAVPRG